MTIFGVYSPGTALAALCTVTSAICVFPFGVSPPWGVPPMVPVVDPPPDEPPGLGISVLGLIPDELNPIPPSNLLWKSIFKSFKPEIFKFCGHKIFGCNRG